MPAIMKPTSRRQLWPSAVILAILLLAFALRLHALDAQSLWYDEAVTAQVASRGIAELTRWTADDIQPPLYYYVVAGWTRLAGRSEWALRFPSAFFGVLTVALLWTMARRLFGKSAAWNGGFSRFLSLRNRPADPRGGWRTALLTALLPLYVYYAQEARMYTLLMFLGALAGYALLRAWGQGSRGAGEWGWWIAFVLSAAAMLYTHYFGVFLLIAYACCFLAAWSLRFRSSASVRARLRPIFTFGIATLGIILLYLPWLPAMLNRYRVDASYWQGALKLGEALRHVALSFTVAAPEMMLEGEGVGWLSVYGAVLALAIAALLWRRRQGETALLLTVLIVPVVAVLFLASRTPKFNPRYLMLVSPAYLLLLAGGIAALVTRRSPGPSGSGMEALVGLSGQRNRPAEASIPEVPFRRGTMQYAVCSTLALSVVAFLVAMSLLSIRNWFTDPAFTKAQWRELAAFVRRERTPDEAVLLVSGHAYPAWEYYAADIPATRLPPIDILDVNAVLGFEAGGDLAAALRGKAGAWLVTWQDEVVDPAGFVPYFLNRAGVEQPVPSSFWHVGLRYWQLRADAIYPTEARPQHVQDANFDHKLALLGWDDPVDGQITVYWRVLNTLQQDYQVSVGIENAAGVQVGHWDGRPAGYDYPTTRWQPGQALFGHYPLALPTGAPASVYTVTLTVYSATDPAGLDLRDEADNPAGKRVRLGPVRLD